MNMKTLFMFLHCTTIIAAVANNTDDGIFHLSFDSDLYAANVTEHSSVGTFIAQVKVMCSEMARVFCDVNVSYKLSSYNYPVGIDEDGIIRVAHTASFDREMYQEGINLTVQAVAMEKSLNRPQMLTTRVLITLDDINDNSPTFICTYPFSVRNTTVDAIIGKVTALEWDIGPNSNVTYEFVDFASSSSDCKEYGKAESFPFRIEILTGSVTVLSSDFNCRHYSTIVRACDNPMIGDRRCDIAPVTFSFSKSNLSDETSVVLTTTSPTKNTPDLEALPINESSLLKVDDKSKFRVALIVLFSIVVLLLTCTFLTVIVICKRSKVVKHDAASATATQGVQYWATDDKRNLGRRSNDYVYLPTSMCKRMDDISINEKVEGYDFKL